MSVERAKKLIKDYPDFPQKGVIFRDISPVIADKESFKFIIDEMAERVRELDFDKILAIDARGFIFASALAYKIRSGLIMCRKPSKLPGELITEAFGYEYDTSSLSVQKDSVGGNDRVLIVDDVLATGNTTLAAYKAVRKRGAKIPGIIFFLELGYLDGRKLLRENIPDATGIHSILTLKE